MRYLRLNPYAYLNPNAGWATYEHDLGEGNLPEGPWMSVPSGGEIALEVQPGLWVVVRCSEWADLRLLRAPRPGVSQDGDFIPRQMEVYEHPGSEGAAFSQIPTEMEGGPVYPEQDGQVYPEESVLDRVEDV